ncbi:hypothetical protein K501DRAFT_267991 [Backusella circina FSU 941]|nr:hypothetical protein K501DRAFT_267991 [Backusella circina FSU 941]
MTRALAYSYFIYYYLIYYVSYLNLIIPEHSHPNRDLNQIYTIGLYTAGFFMAGFYTIGVLRKDYIIYKGITDAVNYFAATGRTDCGPSSLDTYCASQVFKQSGQNTYERRLEILRSVILLGFTLLASLAMEDPGHTSPVTYCEPLERMKSFRFLFKDDQAGHFAMEDLITHKVYPFLYDAVTLACSNLLENEMLMVGKLVIKDRLHWLKSQAPIKKRSRVLNPMHVFSGDIVIVHFYFENKEKEKNAK